MHFCHPPCEEEEVVTVTHIRANLEQGWVSIEDAAEWLGLKLPLQHELPRVALINAMWSVVKHREVTDDHRFDVIQLDSMGMLYGQAHFVPTHKLSDFLRQLRNAADALAPCKDSLMIVVQGGKTANQIRYERDVRDRLLQPDKYYAAKRKRDVNFRAKRKRDKIEHNNEDALQWLTDNNVVLQ